MFFTSAAKLTGDANTGASREGADLYRYDTNTDTLTDLTADSEVGDENGAAVRGVVGASEDGSYVYYVAGGRLAGDALSGHPNLYLSHAGTTTFIATLEPGDEPTGRRRRCRRRSRSHRMGSIAFDSLASLTGYDNTDANTGSPDTEVSPL